MIVFVDWDLVNFNWVGMVVYSNKEINYYSFMYKF